MLGDAGGSRRHTGLAPPHTSTINCLAVGRDGADSDERRATGDGGRGFSGKNDAQDAARRTQSVSSRRASIRPHPAAVCYHLATRRRTAPNRGPRSNRPRYLLANLNPNPSL